MASIVLPEGIQLLSGVEANRASVIPDVAEPMWSTDTHRMSLGDNARAGGHVLAEDSAKWVEWVGHGLAPLGASGVHAVVSDGASALTDAQAAVGKFPSFYVIGINGNWLRIIKSGFAWLDATNFAVGDTLFLDETTPNTFVNTQPATFSEVACEVLQTDAGGRALAHFRDYRPLKLATTASSLRYFRLQVTAAPVHGGLGREFATLNRIEIFETSGGPDLLSAVGVTVTANSTNGGYQHAPLAGGGASNWGSGAAMPQYVDIDLGAVTLTSIHSYRLTAANDLGNAVYFPIDFTLSAGPTAVGLSVLDTQTGQSVASNSETKTYVV